MQGVTEWMEKTDLVFQHDIFPGRARRFLFDLAAQPLYFPAHQQMVTCNSKVVTRGLVGAVPAALAAPETLNPEILNLDRLNPWTQTP